MISGVYSVRDLKSNYGVPFVSPSDPVVTRDFIGLLRNRDSAYSQFPEDFVLVRIGDFDSDLGLLIPHPEAVVITAVDAKKRGLIDEK